MENKLLKTIFLLIIIITNLNSFAQHNCVNKGDIIIDAFYGYPYFGASFLKGSYQRPTVNTLHSTNHIGAKFEIMLSDKIGVGIEGTYAKATISYFDSNNINYSAGITKLRTLAKVNYHFASTSKFDHYLTLGAGYMKQNYYQIESGANHLSTNSFIEAQIPIACKIGFGIRYFFTDFLGVNAEVGIGGPLIQGGVALKF